uniref:Uncharacterized protein n=1 Tax=Strigamia maritima TaxID=126957 RepID=T1IQB5_STRMM
MLSSLNEEYFPNIDRKGHLKIVLQNTPYLDTLVCLSGDILTDNLLLKIIQDQENTLPNWNTLQFLDCGIVDTSASRWIKDQIVKILLTVRREANWMEALKYVPTRQLKY